MDKEVKPVYKVVVLKQGYYFLSPVGYGIRSPEMYIVYLDADLGTM